MIGVGQSKTEQLNESSGSGLSPTIENKYDQGHSKSQGVGNKADHVSLIDSNMIEYMPKMSDTSAILSDLQISNLCAQFPSYMRNNDWKKVFRMDQDGCSLLTFF